MGRVFAHHQVFAEVETVLEAHQIAPIFVELTLRQLYQRSEVLDAHNCRLKKFVRDPGSRKVVALRLLESGDLY